MSHYEKLAGAGQAYSRASYRLGTYEPVSDGRRAVGAFSKATCGRIG